MSDSFEFKLSNLEEKKKELKHHVRFWCNKKKDYDLFKDICASKGLKAQEVFNEFILQFNEQNKGKL